MARRLITSALVFSTVLAAALSAATPPEVTQPVAEQVLAKGGSPVTVTLTDHFQAKDVTGTTVRVTAHVGSLGTGTIDLELFDTQTPLTVANFLAYMNAGLYTNNVLHRSIPGFIIQDGGYYFTGNPAALASVPAFAPVQNEFAQSNVRGTVAMAKVGNDPNSATSQWFINLADNSQNLDNQNGGFTVFGHVLGNGMAIADDIAAVKTYDATIFNGIPSDWTNISVTADTLNATTFTLGNIVLTSIAAVPPLFFGVSSDNAGVVAASISGNVLTITPSPTKTGHANITVTATDLDNGQTQTTFEAVIPGPTVITANPPNTTATAGDSATITIGADGGPSVTYQWQRLAKGSKTWVNVTNGDDFSGATMATLGITTPDSSMSGDQYRCVVTNPGNPTVTSKVATLTVDFAPAFLTTPANVAVKAPAAATFKASSTANPAASYRWQFSSDGGAYANLTNGPGVVGALTSALKITSNASIDGFHYRYIATNSINSTISAPGILTVTASPKITLQPVATLTANVGVSASFTVAATGMPSVTYQWKKNNVAIGNATSSTLTINPVGKTDAATYTVVVSNGVAPAATSKPAKLVVDFAPGFTTNPANVSVKAGAAATFRVVAKALPVAMTYQWQVSADGGTTFTNIVNGPGITGATTTTLKYTTTIDMDQNEFQCIATNSVGGTTSTAATVTVQPKP